MLEHRFRPRQEFLLGALKRVSSVLTLAIACLTLLGQPSAAEGDSVLFQELFNAGKFTRTSLDVERDDARSRSPTRRAPLGRRQLKGENPPPRKLRPDLPATPGPWGWKITKPAWTAADEQGYAEFIRTIGESQCKTVHECLTSEASNPLYYKKSPAFHQFYADCADLPFVLRAYYAWQNELPFSFSLRLGPHKRTPGHKTGLTGNRVVMRQDIVGPGPDLRVALKAISDYITTEHFRSPPGYDGQELPDHYPVAINRESIRAGTVLFDPDGHVAVVYKVAEDGRVYYIDAHPDNSLTRGLFDREFARAVPTMGAGFKLWRPQRLVDAKRAKDGSLIGGRIVLATDAELPHWSDEQQFGTQMPRADLWSDAEFEHNGESVEFHDYVRFKLAFPGFKYDPIDETRTRIRQICRELNYRQTTVELAIRDGIHRRPQPDRLPDNIYATQGYWETYSTPSRDARIKSAYEQLRDEIERFLEHGRDNKNVLAYSGNNLRRDLLSVYREEAEACQVTYVNSDGVEVSLDFDEVRRRLFDLSFDPHHCVERRWGASDSNELRSCTDDPIKAKWYVAEARLRNQLVRTYGEKMGWNLEQLLKKDLDIGIEEPPEVDSLQVLLGDEPELASRD